MLLLSPLPTQLTLSVDVVMVLYIMCDYSITLIVLLEVMAGMMAFH